MNGPHVHGIIVQVPNRKTNATEYVTEFDKDKTLVDGLTHENSCSSISCNARTKKILKRGVERAKIIDHRHKDKKEKRIHAEVESAETIIHANLTDSVFLGDMLNQIDDRTTVT